MLEDGRPKFKLGVVEVAVDKAGVVVPNENPPVVLGAPKVNEVVVVGCVKEGNPA